MKVHLHLTFAGKTASFENVEIDDELLGDEASCPYPRFAIEDNNDRISELFRDEVKVNVVRVWEGPKPKV